MNYGFALGELRRYEESAQYYRKSIQINPHYPKAYCSCDWVLARLGKMKRQSHTSTKCDWNLMKLHRYEEAVSCYRKAFELSLQDADAYYNCGSALEKMGRYGEAIFSDKKAREPNSHYSKSYLEFLNKVTNLKFTFDVNISISL